MTRALATLALAALIAGCGGPRAHVEGDRENGRLLLRQFGCGHCHRIPGVADATGAVGPPLAKVGERAYLAGVIANTPANMAAFIRDPKSLDPRTTMPTLGVGETHARDMVAYLLEAR